MPALAVVGPWLRADKDQLSFVHEEIAESASLVYSAAAEAAASARADLLLPILRSEVREVQWMEALSRLIRADLVVTFIVGDGIGIPTEAAVAQSLAKPQVVVMGPGARSGLFENDDITITVPLREFEAVDLSTLLAHLISERPTYET